MASMLDHQKPTVLVVDDDGLIRKIVGDALRKSDYNIIEADNGHKALDEINLKRPDLVLLDLVMPKMDGFETCRQLRQMPEFSDLPIIAMANFHDTTLVGKVYEAGATDITSKPINVAALPHRVKYVLRASTAQQRLREESHFVQTVLNTTESLITVLDSQGKIVRVNNAFEKLTGRRQEELAGKSFIEECFAPDRHNALKDTMQRLLSENGTCYHENQLRAKDGQEKIISWSCSKINTPANGGFYLVASGTDLTARQRSEDQIYKLGNFDSLTGLPNRQLFSDRVTQICKKAQRSELSGAVMFLDVDRFKRISESISHEAGDDLVVQVSKRIRECLRESDSISHNDHIDETPNLSRHGGDEFCILLSDITNVQDVLKVSYRLLKELKKPYLLLSGQEVSLTASIGISNIPLDGEDAETLIKNAQIAKSHAKNIGGDCCHFYTKEMTSAAVERLLLESDFRKGLEAGEFELYYQPQINLATGKIEGVEALARWKHSALGWISPGIFIPIASESGLIDSLVDWSLKEVCSQIRQWAEMGFADLKVAVNIPSRQFLQDELPEKVEALIKKYGIKSTSLELEITEDSVMSQEEKCVEVLKTLKKTGVGLSIDDFGTGYSSLSYLNQFSLDTLKVDRSFIQEVPGNAKNCSLITAIVSMAHSLGLKVVAEGVETVEQLDFIKATNCEYVQGYYFSKPLPASELNDLLGKVFSC